MAVLLGVEGHSPRTRGRTGAEQRYRDTRATPGLSYFSREFFLFFFFWESRTIGTRFFVAFTGALWENLGLLIGRGKRLNVLAH